MTQILGDAFVALRDHTPEFSWDAEPPVKREQFEWLLENIPGLPPFVYTVEFYLVGAQPYALLHCYAMNSDGSRFICWHDENDRHAAMARPISYPLPALPPEELR
jgi:hypothetical protein